jgi:molybdopterin/thiamine biosynthesis adenylyltransferase
VVEEDIYSRSRLAGYKPEILFKISVLIVGLGALGQNLALNLALAGVGELLIVDFDIFEAHNATRSPLYPTEQEREQWGKAKAQVIAHKLLPMMTAPSPRIRYAVASIQSLGDLPLLEAQLVFSAVDNQNARAYLAERCHLIRRPLIEGGLYAENLNISICGPDGDDPCYRCISPKRTGAFSCALNALMLEEQQVLPAIQNTAAVLAGLQAEAGIRWLHGDLSLCNTYIHANIHTMTMNCVHLVRNELCPGIHWSHTNWPPKVLEIRGNATLIQLMEAVEAEIGPAEIRFPEVFVMSNFCAHCEQLTKAYVPEWEWLRSPYCVNCGGPFLLADDDSNLSGKKGVHTVGDEEDIVNLKCNQVGLPSGTLCEIWPETNREQYGERYFIQLGGTIEELMEEVLPLTMPITIERSSISPVPPGIYEM